MTCLPDHGPHYARGLCRRCYHRERWHGRHVQYPIRRVVRPSTELAARGQRLYDELKAAEPYGGRATWNRVADALGVKPKTLEKARERARQRESA